MNAKETIEKVEKTDSLEELNSLREEENRLDEPRKTVITALDAREKALEAEEDKAGDSKPKSQSKSDSKSEAKDEETAPEGPYADAPDEVSDDLGAGASDEWTRKQQIARAANEGVEITEDDLVSDDEGLGSEEYRTSVPGNYAVGALSAEGQLENAKLAEQSKELREKKIEEFSDKFETIEDFEQETPFFEGSLREQAEKSANNVDEVDPTLPVTNLDYIKDRAEAMLSGDSSFAQTQEGQISANPDDFAQRDSASRLAAEALRLETEVTNRIRPEMGSQHERAAAYAEEHPDDDKQGYVDPLQYPHYYSNADENLEERDEATAETDEELTAQAEKLLSKLDGEKAVVPESRRESPDDVGSMTERQVPEDYPITTQPAEHPIIYSSPNHPAMGLFSMVSRQDYAHEEIGIVTKTDLVNPTHPLVHVEFPNEEGGWFAPSNLRYEGDARQYETADVGESDEDD